MAVPGDRLWSNTNFYSAYLPAPDTVKARKYAVVVLEEDRGESPGVGRSRPFCTPSPASLPPCMQEAVFPDSAPLKLMESLGRDSDARSTFSDVKSVGSACGSTHGEKFFLIPKKNLIPPHVKHILGKIRHCFELCGESVNGRKCHCQRVHLLRMDMLPPELSASGITSLNVSLGFMVYSIGCDRIRPTAGFFFACGLLKENIIDAVQPILCRYNGQCRYGSRCLYIHADMREAEQKTLLAETSLSAQLRPYPSSDDFLTELAALGLCDVGDLQELSTAAFDALVSRSAKKYRLKWLHLAVLRSVRPSDQLERVLRSFHGISASASLPRNLTTVHTLLDLSSKEFYALGLPLKIQAACEQIRSRYESDHNYNTISLKKEMKGSFFPDVSRRIEVFRTQNAHVSWRKNDPNRPVVTSMITFVDPDSCKCRADAFKYNLGGSFATSPEMQRSTSETGPRKSPMHRFKKNNLRQNDMYPRFSWCECQRNFKMAVNYELSTPSGSRCSEQNALGKLASSGVPTTAVREVFVHGENKGSNKDPNPLFPCGVCENMLRKVNRDVFDAHGGDVMLYMFDSTLHPKNLIYLPITEISNRDGKGFKKFLADMREE